MKDYINIDEIRRGAAVIVCTDTVYGLGVAINPENLGGAEILYEIKERKYDKPIAILIGSLDDLFKYGAEIPAQAARLAEKYWPGALTIVVKASAEIPQCFRAADGSVALRMPNNQKVLSLIHKLECPLATTSANKSGQDAPAKFAEISFDIKRKVKYHLVDDGAQATRSGVASTIIDARQTNDIKILRQGDIILY